MQLLSSTMRMLSVSGSGTMGSAISAGGAVGSAMSVSYAQCHDNESAGF